MVRELLSSPCWFCSTVALALVVYACGRSIYEMVKKRWSLTHIAKRMTRIEQKLDEVKEATKPAPRPPRLRLVLNAAKKPPRPSKENVVYAEFGKRRKMPPDEPPPGAA